jgi:DNA-binding transcriptional regulator GbsR (MarR family)
LNEKTIRKSYTENCDLLRSFTEIQNNSDDLELQKDLQDEYLAILLQNEEFLNCLKTDNDFMNSLNDEILNKSIDLDYKPHQDIDYSYGNGNHLFLSHLKDFIYILKIN